MNKKKKTFIIILKRLVIIMTILSLFACSSSKRTEEDITSISISCNHMNYYYCYSFSLEKVNDEYLLTANYFPNEEAAIIEKENITITQQDWDSLLQVIKDTDTLKAMEKYRKSDQEYEVSDETTYSITIIFDDDSSLTADKQFSSDLTDHFYTLANKYIGGQNGNTD